MGGKLLTEARGTQQRNKSKRLTNYTADDVGGAVDIGRIRSLVMAVSLCMESIAMNGFLG